MNWDHLTDLPNMLSYVIPKVYLGVTLWMSVYLGITLFEVPFHSSKRTFLSCPGETGHCPTAGTFVVLDVEKSEYEYCCYRYIYYTVNGMIIY